MRSLAPTLPCASARNSTFILDFANRKVYYVAIMIDPNHNSNENYANPLWLGNSLKKPTVEQQGVWLTSLLKRYRTELSHSGALDQSLLKMTGGDPYRAEAMKAGSHIVFPTIMEEHTPLRTIALGFKHFMFNNDGQPAQTTRYVEVADKFRADAFVPHEGIHPAHAQRIGNQALFLMTLRDTGIMPDLDLACGRINGLQ
jgi:hypothetical protein